MGEYEEFMQRAKEALLQSQNLDSWVVNLAELIEELDKSFNLLYERLRELYGIYNPELLEKDLNKEKFLKEVKKLKKSEIGYNLSEEDLDFILDLVKELESLLSLRKKTEEYLAKVVKENYPNLYSTAGALITAKLIGAAGSLKELARKPSSTIQVYGAEKALFRHKKTGAKPPKYGYILQHPFVMSKPPKERGKAAKELAAKISLAARKDYYGKENK